MEKADFRENLARISAAFPGQEVLTMQQCYQYLGICYRTFKKRYPKLAATRGCTVVQFARAIS